MLVLFVRAGMSVLSGLGMRQDARWMLNEREHPPAPSTKLPYHSKSALIHIYICIYVGIHNYQSNRRDKWHKRQWEYRWKPCSRPCGHRTHLIQNWLCVIRDSWRRLKLRNGIPYYHGQGFVCDSVHGTACSSLPKEHFFSGICYPHQST